ncbi:MAG: putative phosphopantetheine-binding protein [Gemmatimonadetes bacterium]|nr:putative phosphopantetheine-binding protein [Gemmatimonadota bacterium]
MTDFNATNELHEWIRGWLGRELKLSPDDIAADKTFVRYGMDSVHAMMLVGDLEEHLKRRLPPTLAWTYPTVEALATHLAETNETVTAAPPATAESDLLSRLDDLSEEEIDRLLAEQQSQQAAV